MDDESSLLSKKEFFAYLGIVITVFLAVNAAAINFMSGMITSSENRLGVRIDNLESDSDDFGKLITEVRLSLQAIETKLGIDSRISSQSSRK